MDNCTLDCIEIMGQLNHQKMCEFTQNQCVQDTIQFVQGYYCLFNGSFLILVFLGIPLFFLLFKLINVAAQHYMSPCVNQFIQEFKISPTVAGVTFLAFANGAPDIITAIIAGSSDSQSTVLIPFGSIFGACLFSTAFILSACIFVLPNQTLTIQSRYMMLPLSVYIIAMLYIISVSVFYGKMNIGLACVPLGLYVIYIGIILKIQNKKKKKQTLIQKSQEQFQEENSKQTVITSTAQISQSQAQAQQGKKLQRKVQQLVKKEQDDDQIRQQQIEGIINKLDHKIQKLIMPIFQKIIPPFTSSQFDRVNTITSLLVSPLILAATQSSTFVLSSVPQIFKSFVGPIPIFLLISLPALVLLGYVIYCRVRDQDPYYIKPFTVYSFFVCIAILAFVCSILINLVELMQILTGINSVFLGLTVFAWANCIPDYLTIVHFAKNGNSATAVGGIFSGQLLNFLMGFGISLVVRALSSDGPFDYQIFNFKGTTYDKISDSIVMCVIFGCLLYLIYTFVMIKLQKGVFMRREANIAKWFYLGFLVITCLLSVLTDFFNEISCDMDNEAIGAL